MEPIDVPIRCKCFEKDCYSPILNALLSDNLSCCSVFELCTIRYDLGLLTIFIVTA